MRKLGKLKFDKQSGWYQCTQPLGTVKVELSIDTGQSPDRLAELTAIAQHIVDGWKTRHQRLTKLVRNELVAQGYLEEQDRLPPSGCVPFYLRVSVSPEGEVSCNIAFNVPAVLDADDEYVDIEEEIDSQWLNIEICSTE